MHHAVQVSLFHTVVSLMPLLAGTIIILAAIRMVILAARMPARAAQQMMVHGYRHRVTLARHVVPDDDHAPAVVHTTVHGPVPSPASAPELPF